ncbi:MFS transporter [Corynebacterium kutscheri]|uniref:Major facilitator superfamily permease n=1 Tax=Corynebacterium kutscheri TaxID=35755 RepID=A0AB38VPJ4_9CORY|nr:MFS transporter [Corynebacterium kutscheri]VEH04524.1 Major facilitator superfamily permease [Corynebacterium kutscheri]
MNQPTKAQRWSFLFVISLGLLMIGLDNSILYTALPTLRHELHTTELEGLWIINAYPLVLAGLLLGTGTLGDKIGHRRMFEIGLVLFGLASLAAAFAPNATALIAARGALGAGAATMMPATLALLRTTFKDVRERNTAIGVWGSVATIGAAAGPVVGGFLLEHYYWGSVFMINVPIVIITLIASYFLAPNNRANPEKHWDFISSLYAMFAMMGMVIVIKELVHQPINSLVLGIATAIMAIGSILFIHRQHRLDEPLLAFDIFKNRIFVAGVVAACLGMFCLTGVELITTQRFQESAGFSPLEAGLITGAMAISAFPASLLGGANLHRWGFRPLISGGFAVISLGLPAGIWALSNNHVEIFVIAFMATGFGAGLLMSVASTAIIGSAPAHRTGMASAVEEVSFEFGTLISVALMGSLISGFYALLAPAEISDSYTTGFTHPLLADAAHQAFDNAYYTTIGVGTIVAIIGTIVTAILLAGNPKETKYAHE